SFIIASAACVALTFFLQPPVTHYYPPSFPTRRSSDLQHGAEQSQRPATRGRVHRWWHHLVAAGLRRQRHHGRRATLRPGPRSGSDRKSTRLNSSHSQNSYAVVCL